MAAPAQSIAPLALSAAELDALSRSLAEYVPEVMRVTHTPGLTVAVSHGPELILNTAHGFSDLQRQIVMKPSTRVRAGSMAKLYTATAVMQLVERGIVELYGSVRSYLPDLPITNPLGEREITIYDLLTYRSGLATDVSDWQRRRPVDSELGGYLSSVFTDGTRRVYRSQKSRWTAKVGDKYQYSSLGVAALGLVVERLNPGGQSLADYVARNILAPIGADATELGASPGCGEDERRPSDADLSRGYAGFGSTLVATPVLYSPLYPASGLITTARDQVRLLAACLTEGRAGATQILEPASVTAMVTPQVPQGGPGIEGGWWTGLGMEMSNLGRLTFGYGHAGGYPWGWWSDGRAFPRLKIAIAVCTNKREMMYYYNPSSRSAAGLIIDFVASRLERRPQASEEPTSRSWPWKASYVMGLMMSERVYGLFGIRPEPSSAAIDDIVAGAAGDTDTALWDPDGFRTGVSDVLRLPLTASSIEAFISSRELRVSREELRLLALEFGRAGDFPLPMPYWAQTAGDIGSE